MIRDYKVYRDIDGKQGSGYIEILPGNFEGKWWNPESLFILEDEFAVVGAVIGFRVPEYDHYNTCTTIDAHACWAVIRDLEALAGALAPTASVADWERLPAFKQSNYVLRFADLEENKLAFRQMIEELVAWLRETMAYNRSIAVLGV